jgi:DNA-binding NarL/FixJ family response regulator
MFACVAKVPNGIQDAQVSDALRGEKMKVFIVEDAEIVRETLTIMLSKIPGVEVIGTAADEQGAIAQICAMSPDVAVLDISLQPGSGIEVLKAVKKHNSAIKVMMLTNYTDEIYVNRCMGAGADYFFDKSHEFMRVGEVLR